MLDIDKTEDIPKVKPDTEDIPAKLETKADSEIELDPDIPPSETDLDGKTEITFDSDDLTTESAKGEFPDIKLDSEDLYSEHNKKKNNIEDTHGDIPKKNSDEIDDDNGVIVINTGRELFRANPETGEYTAKIDCHPDGTIHYYEAPDATWEKHIHIVYDEDGNEIGGHPLEKRPWNDRFHD